MKRNTAFIFTLLASIVLLAHAVVPHHHHESEVCFTNDHCQTDCDGHDDDATEHNHQHDGDTDAEFCALKTDIVIPTNQLKQECKWVKRVDIDAGFETLQPALSNASYFLQLSPLLARPPTPFITTKYSCFASPIKGLRAPPIV